MLKEILKFKDGTPLNVKWPIELKNKKGQVVYIENEDGSWAKRKVDDKGNIVYQECNGDYWEKIEYNDLGLVSYFENSKGLKQGVSIHNVKELTISEIEKLLGHRVKVVK